MSVSKLFTYITPVIAIDAGTNQTRIWSNLLEDDEAATVGGRAAGGSPVAFETLSVATCLAVENKTGKVLQIGDEALAMEGRVGPEITVVKPIRRGEVTNKAHFRAFLQMLLADVVAKISFSRPIMMISVPSALSVAKREILVSILYDLGAQEAYTMNQSLASAIGAGVPIADATGSFMMHCGAGSVEASVISLGSSVASDSTWYAGHWLDEYIQTHVLKEHGVVISNQVASQLKEQALDLSMLHLAKSGGETQQKTIRLTGQDVSTSSPIEMQIDPRSIMYPASLFFTQYELLLKRLLAQLPPELSVDVIDKGLLLSGGFAQLAGLEEALRLSLGVPVALVENPSQTVIQGLRTAVLHIDEFKQSIGYQR